MQKRLVWILFSLLASAILAALMGIVWIEWRYSVHDFSGEAYYNGSEKTWAHRGYAKEYPENTLEAYNAALELGSQGLEIDIFYDAKSDSFVISHAPPTPASITDALKLSTVFERFGAKPYYWLDFKNLKSLPPHLEGAALSKLMKLTETYQLQGKIMVESQNADKLARYSAAGFQTAYWANVATNKGFVRQYIASLSIKHNLVENDIAALSLHQEAWTPILPARFNKHVFYLFTVNDAERLKALNTEPTIKIILTDEPLYGRHSP